MEQSEIIRMAREVWGERAVLPFNDLERFAALVAANELEMFPNLEPVINWLESGCDPKEAAKELRIYAAAIRARSN